MDEDDCEERRYELLGFKPQKENIYNKLLPYADTLDEESVYIFREIKENLTKAILARELRPGCTFWSTRLLRYIKIYGFKFSKEEHIALVKLFYEIVTIPNLDPTRLTKFSGILTYLLKKRYLLTQDDLQLDWRPLYELDLRVLEKSKCDIGINKYFSTLESSIDNLIKTCRMYFPVSVTQEVLDEFRPKLCPYQTEILGVIQNLESFLPLICKPEEAHMGYKLWLEELMTWWEVCQNSNQWDSYLTTLIAKLAHFNLGHISWERHLPSIYIRFLRTLQLPVTYRQRKSVRVHKIDIGAMTLWIVCTLGGPSDLGFVHLERLMGTLESYFHSANSGRWSGKLREFLRRISQYFVQRVHSERFRTVAKWEQSVPLAYHLTDADIERFIVSLRPALAHAIYTAIGVTDVRMTLNDLAALRADLVVPLVVDRVWAAMESVTEPHRLTTSVMSLVVVSRYMVRGAAVNYPEGPSHVLPLLHSLLPGIDPNDMRKSYVTFNLIGQLVNVAPACDSSAAAATYSQLTEAEVAVCEATAAYEDFVVQFVERLCSFVEARAVEFVRQEQTVDLDVKNAAETMAEGAVAMVVTTVLGQCSPRIFTAALKKIYNFTTSRVLEAKVSGKLLALVCHAFTFANPRETLNMFLPHLCETVERLLNETDVMNDEIIDEELQYNLVLLTGIVDVNMHIIPHLERLTAIMDKVLYMKSVPGMKLGNRLLTLIMNTLATMTPTEYRSVNKPFTDDVKEFLTIREWGIPGDINNLNMDWYIPGEREITQIQELLNRYLVPEIDKLNAYVDNDADITRDDLRRSFRIIYSMLSADPVLPIWDEPQLKLAESCLEPSTYVLNLGVQLHVKMPDGSNVRKTIANVIHRVQKKVLETDENDTKNLHLIVCIVELLLMNNHRNRTEARWRQFHSTKKTLQDNLHQHKKHLRHMLIDRVLLQHEVRCANRSATFTETHRMLLLDLFELSVCRYSMIRVTAQAKLHSTITTYVFSYKTLIPRIREILQLDSTEHHDAFKGCLHVLLGPKVQPLVVRHEWTMIKEVWPLLVRSCPSEKPSIVNLLTTVKEKIHRCFPTISINFEIPESCLNSAKVLGNCNPAINLNLDNMNILIADGFKRQTAISEQNRLDYNELLTSMLDAASSGKLHWRYHEMALSLLLDLAHPNANYTPELVKFILKSLIHDSLSVRKLALNISIIALMQNKPKFKKVVLDGKDRVTGGDIQPGIREDNKWLLYNSASVPCNEQQWNETRFVHDQYTGYFTWPKELKVYASSDEQPSASKRLNALTAHEQEVYDFFQNTENLATLVKYLKLEDKKGNDKFNPFRFIFFKNLFKMFEDTFMPVILPHLVTLVNCKEEQSQRCCSEIIAGIIRGSKHWSYTKVEAMWTEVIPLLRIALNNISEETIFDWNTAICASLESRDPNRHHWLLEFLLDEPLNESTSFIASARLQLLQMALAQQRWRNAELLQRTVTYLLPHLSHPFQNVRERISSCLTLLLSTDIQFPVMKGRQNGPNTMENTAEQLNLVDNFFEKVSVDLDVFYKLVLSEGVGAVVGNGNGNNGNHHYLRSEDVTMDKSQVTSTSPEERDRLVRLFKVVSKYITGSAVLSIHPPLPSHYQLIPLATLLQTTTDSLTTTHDDELATVSTKLLAVLGSTVVRRRHIPAVLDTVEQIAGCRLWSARSVAAQLIPVLVFHNMPELVTETGGDWVTRVVTLVLRLLEDSQPEVRTEAAVVLSGLLHCGFVPSPMTLLETFKKKAAIKKPKSKQMEVTWLKVRHAAVLGFCAFIKAYPYDVPDFLPDIFNHLGPHLNDPQPIPAAIRKTLGDFKRTHHDNWGVHKLQFTEEELSVLTDLTVPPSYYV